MGTEPASSDGRLPRVSIILPAHNEAATIAAVVRDCQAAVPPSKEIIVVDDGSADRTADAAEEAGAHVLRLGRNHGKGEALRRGVDQSRGEILVFLDADGQDDPFEIPLLLEPLSRGADLVIGSRFLGRFDPGAITATNRLGTLLLTHLVNTLFGVRVTDMLAGFRAVRRTLLGRVTLQASGYDIETDLLLQAVKIGARVVEVPVRRGARRHGQSGLHPIADGLRILRRILRARWETLRSARR
jgi:glycosyltransferase involved in cell wall biosynthesis